MPISVLEAMKLDIFKNFRLIAGHRGLENKIEKVGILDYEFDKKAEEQFVKGQFEKGQFVISSLLFAKDEPSLIIEAVKGLIEDEVSGLAVKNIYYNDLPAEVIDLANEEYFPIFIFDRNSAYFEDIITDITDQIRIKDNYELLEIKVDILIKKNISKAMIRELALEINSSFRETFIVLYCKKKEFIDDSNNLAIMERLRRNKNINHSTSVFKYSGGILIISSHDQLDKKDMKSMVNSLLSTIGISSYEYYIGVSDLHINLDEMDKGINESIFALKSGEVTDNSPKYYNEIGVYKLLLPHIDNSWTYSFYNEIIHPIKDYDEKFHTEIFNTALKYIEKDGNIKATAEALFLHENTIRYRINKIKEILHMEGLEGGFYEQLSIAVKIYKLHQRYYS